MILHLVLKSTGRTRAAIYIKNSIKYQRRTDLEPKNESVVWLTIHPKRAQPFNFQCLYRQWQGVGEGGAIANTNSVQSQVNRLKTITTKWKQSLNERETISVGDTNLDLNIDYTNPTQLSQHNRSLIPIYRVLNEDILSNGAVPIKTRPTKTNIQKPSTWIDHLITNKPEKISDHKIIPTGLSDHLILIFYRKNKNPPHHKKFSLTRNFKEVDWDKLLEDMNQDQRLYQAATTGTSTEIAANIINTITQHLDNQQKVRKVQCKTKTPGFITPETRDIIKRKQQALTRAKTTKSMEDTREFRHLRNLAHKLIKKDKNNNLKEQFDAAKDNPKQ